MSFENFAGNKPSDGEIDILRLMFEPLSEREHACSNLQLAVVHGVLGKHPVGRQSFLMKVSKGHVRMIKNGRDRALVIPYLNFIVLSLNSDELLRHI